jgi:hypothetical protein
MSTSALLKASGAAAILAGLLLTISFVFRPGEQDPATLAANPTTVPHTVGILALALCQFALFGIYARIRSASGLFGFISFLIAFVGSNVMSGVWFYSAFVEHIIAAQAPALLARDGPIESGIAQMMFVVCLSIFTLGYILLGVGIALTRAFPRWAGLLLTVGCLLVFGGIATEVFVLSRIGSVLMGLALAWLGYRLWSEAATLAGRAPPA